MTGPSKYTVKRTVLMTIVLEIAVEAVAVTILPCERSRSTAQTAAISLAQAQPTPVLAATETAEDKDAIASMLEPWHGDLDDMVARRYIRILVTFNRTNFFLDRGQQKGLTYEGGKAFEDYLNRELKTGTIRVNVVFIPVRRDQIFSALAEGRGDIAAASLTITPEGQKRAHFAVPFLRGVRQVVVTGPNVPALVQAENLSGRKVYVRRSSAYFESLSRFSARLEQSGKSPVEIVAADEQLEDEDILDMVNAGIVPATVVDDYLARFWNEILDGLVVHREVVVNSDGEIAWAVRKGAPRLKAVVDRFAASHGNGTLVFNDSFRRYLRDATYVKNSASEEEQRKFRSLRGIFERYGGEYDIPWLLLAAQGYQESQLDQSRHSQSGAVGVMQVKPSTAAAHPVYITGVEKSADANIHAGAKYLRWIVDEFYKDEPMNRVDKGLFAFATYNAGAGHIHSLRRKAEQRGLDPNKWFQNVEVVVAEDVGRETVQYVANIYKYYVAYRLLVEEAEKGGGDG